MDDSLLIGALLLLFSLLNLGVRTEGSLPSFARGWAVGDSSATLGACSLFWGFRGSADVDFEGSCSTIQWKSRAGAMIQVGTTCDS